MKNIPARNNFNFNARVARRAWRSRCRHMHMHKWLTKNIGNIDTESFFTLHSSHFGGG
jgi:hypothetical protein